METYEKKYKELEGKIKKAYLYAQTDSTKAVLEEILPELAESKDEKIRKELIEYIKSIKWADYALFQKFSPDDVIAWLEKQQSVEEIVERYKTSWYNEGRIDGRFEGITDDVKYQQGWHDALEKQGEQNSTWSEEDERLRKTSISFLKHYADKGYENAVECIDWLKSIKDRVQPHPRREWSKEDKVMLDEIIDFFENGTVKFQHDLSLYASWLKSLRPQPHWKPSEEQIQCLHDAIEHYHTSGYPASKLNELYEQMSKIYKL